MGCAVMKQAITITPMTITAKANANIALIKYWGKRNTTLNLPLNSSISITLDQLNTTTSVKFDQNLKEDIFIFENKEIKDEKISHHLDLIRKKAKIKDKAFVKSENNFPTAAGLASSSSGFAALTLAATKAAGLDLDKKELSTLARKGSGSASRSIFGGFVEWEKGQNDCDDCSFAHQILSPSEWKDFRVITTIISEDKKLTSSRKGMAQTIATSPMYQSWLDTIEEDLSSMRQGINNRDFTLVGKTAEANCFKMHATMLTANPPIIYWLPQTISIMKAILEWRSKGLESYFTIDAGPQVKILCQEKNVSEIRKELQQFDLQKIIVCKPGSGAKIIHEN